MALQVEEESEVDVAAAEVVMATAAGREVAVEAGNQEVVAQVKAVAEETYVQCQHRRHRHPQGAYSSDGSQKYTR